mmetsp:Transcript_50721/g.154291  ORF Transcript_50721/g.154291 Transcript_50721/m.154291 type:complete len:422 (+) Transcript_50721:487-1752(+)
MLRAIHQKGRIVFVVVILLQHHVHGLIILRGGHRRALRVLQGRSYRFAEIHLSVVRLTVDDVEIGVGKLLHGVEVWVVRHHPSGGAIFLQGIREQPSCAQVPCVGEEFRGLEILAVRWWVERSHERIREEHWLGAHKIETVRQLVRPELHAKRPRGATREHQGRQLGEVRDGVIIYGKGVEVPDLFDWAASPYLRGVAGVDVAAAISHDNLRPPLVRVAVIRHVEDARGVLEARRLRARVPLVCLLGPARAAALEIVQQLLGVARLHLKVVVIAVHAFGAAAGVNLGDDPGLQRGERARGAVLVLARRDFPLLDERWLLLEVLRQMADGLLHHGVEIHGSMTTNLLLLCALDLQGAERVSCRAGLVAALATRRGGWSRQGSARHRGEAAQRNALRDPRGRHEWRRNLRGEQRVSVRVGESV